LVVFQIGQNIIHPDRNTVKISFYELYQPAFLVGGISVGEPQIIDDSFYYRYRSVGFVDLQICIRPY
jgi:hypothetical protein